MEKKKDCGFQYYNGYKMVVDKTRLTLNEAKELWNENYEDMVKQTKEGVEIEVAIWIDMVTDGDYRDSLIYLNAPKETDGYLWEKKFYNKI